jgi:xylulokinase
MYLTFDVGTTSVKTVLFDEEGKVRGKVIRNYTLDTPAVGWIELDPEVYWKAVVEGFREVLRSSGVDPRQVKTVSGCSQGETTIFLDASDRPVRPAMVWLDTRARDEVAELSRIVSDAELFRVTGLSNVDPTWSAPKMLWVRKNQPEVFGKTAKFLLVEDYITYRLTGRFAGTPNLLSSTMFVDVHAGRYWPKIVDAVGVAGRLPEIVASGQAVGTLTAAAAVETGLARATVVVKGAMDQATSAVGAGNFLPGIITETTGSVMAIGVTTPRIDFASKVLLPYQPHIVGGGLLILPYVQTAGSAYKWFRDSFCQDEVRQAGGLEEAYDAMNRLAVSVPPASEGLVFLPYLAGAGQPENDPDAKGVFYGITLKHGKGHFARAIQESIGYMLKKILAAVASSGVPVTEIRSMGGGARSDLWLQIKADITGCPIVRMEEEETSTLGAAMLASVACGDYPDAAAAAAAMVRLGRRFEPDRACADAYARGYALYSGLYDALAPVFHTYSS